MSLENFSSQVLLKHSPETTKLAEGFRNLDATLNKSSIYKHLEEDLLQENFCRAVETDAIEVLYNNTLLCRSELFSRVLDLLIEKQPLKIQGSFNEANMCTMSSGKGFRIAMEEGFSGKDVGGMIKVVVSFAKTHMAKQEKISTASELWNVKPETAQVSLSGSGEIHFEDIAMISFRFPIHHFPEELLTDDERDRLDQDRIKFVVRHYIPDKKQDHALN